MISGHIVGYLPPSGYRTALPCLMLTYVADIIWAILPEEEHTEIPVGFTQVGHVGMLITLLFS